jgi:hypothetical protein
VAATPFELPRHECIELLNSQRVGRLCIVERGYPLAFPVNYRVVNADGAVNIVVRALPRAAIGTYEGPASFEVDHIDLDRVSAWSLILRGQLRHATSDDHLPDTQPLVTEGRYRWRVLAVTAISGRRFAGTGDDAGFSVDWQPSEN